MFWIGALLAVPFFLVPFGLASAQSPEPAKAIAAANSEFDRLYGEGKYADALALARQTLGRAEQELGKDHSDTLLSVNNLAALYQAQRRYREAEALYKRALEAPQHAFKPQQSGVPLSIPRPL